MLVNVFVGTLLGAWWLGSDVWTIFFGRGFSCELGLCVFAFGFVGAGGLLGAALGFVASSSFSLSLGMLLGAAAQRGQEGDAPRSLALRVADVASPWLLVMGLLAAPVSGAALSVCTVATVLTFGVSVTGWPSFALIVWALLETCVLAVRDLQPWTWKAAAWIALAGLVSVRVYRGYRELATLRYVRDEAKLHELG